MNLDETRKQIDGVDKQIIELLEERMKLVQEVIAYKKENNLPVLDNSRENIVLEKTRERVENPIFADSIVATFQDIMKNSRNFQEIELEQ
ncbi:chorismate mutase [Floricoccus tropicus]|uniref:Chorismate mutase n=1 Tax=Floricoccus tropicus TaxID=1859473 RepID=A0A1E8GM34_9LACT|nr:chorismate mutase [Floricoccus tropicus]OFI49066.1 chorismate mutase [Floricoccus tropicus]